MLTTNKELKQERVFDDLLGLNVNESYLEGIRRFYRKVVQPLQVQFVWNFETWDLLSIQA